MRAGARSPGMRVWMPTAFAVAAIVVAVLLLAGCGGHGSGY